MFARGYRVLFYAAQFDMGTVQQSLTRLINNLKWKEKDDYSKATKKILRFNRDVAGYIKATDNFVYAMIRNVGNCAIRDQPEWVSDLVEKCLYIKEF
ncbi:unnamed protein product [Allacma fusca]|uniref:Uncharacterized protein n=1 Tax=Allacma fusca TaxID=39272 RepID=A0A8J2PQP0_9HEXA|nr:unnamed protein product [Allacma fusca]